MHAFPEDETPPTGSLMPPATTQRRYARPSALSSEPRIVPPFVARPAAPPPEPPQIEEAEPAPTVVNEPPPAEPWSGEPVELDVVQAPVAEADATEESEPVVDEWETAPDDDDHRWEEVPGDEGVVEPAFGADTDAVLEALTQQATDLARREDFPLEAFIVPEQSQRFPSGIEPGSIPTPPDNKPVTSLAERLEKLSHRLRVEDTDSIVRRLASGDRLDALLAGLLAGYLAGKSEQP